MLIRTRIGKLILLTVLFVVAVGGSGQAFAKHTPVYKVDSVSYVKKKSSRKVIIYVGDSRVMYCTCGPIKSSVRTNFVFCFVNGGNVTFIRRNDGSMTSLVDSYIRKYRRKKPVIILNLGLNGNSSPAKNAKRIIKIYKKWMKKYSDLKFYVEGIGPTVINRGPYANSKVIKLNKLLRAYYEPKGIWIDTYDFVKKNKLVNSSKKGMRDYYHYNWKTSKKIMKMLREYVENDTAEAAK